MNRRDALLATTLPLWAIPTPSRATDDDALAARLRQGGVALILRHSITDPGVGDPPGFSLGACATQRNLSAEGRAQAKRIGAWFQARGLVPAQVRSSAWCRCVDTARIAFGQVDAWAALNSFFGDDAARTRQSAALAQAVGQLAPNRFEVWVTHQVNVTALTGEFVAMGEGYVLEPGPVAGAPRIAGRWRGAA